jgi:type I restriction enzyme S subunit
MNKEVMGVQEVSPGYEFVAENPAAPVGYKQTEMGVIPEEWNVKRLGELAKFRTGPFGSSLHKSDYIAGGIPVINPMHIVDGQLLPSFSMSVREETAVRLSDFRLQEGDIILGRRGDMGRCAVVRKQYAGWLCGTGSMIVRPSSVADPRFLQRILSSQEIVVLIENSSVGSTMINLNQSTLIGLPIKFPSKSEQRAIATALSDVDALLEELDRLIAKKRDIKQATMQQLLTGETRLPGFEGEWKSFRLGDHVTFLKTGTNSRAELQSDGNDASVRYLHYGDIHASKLSFITPSVLPFLPSEKAATLGRLKNGDLIMSDASEDIEGIGKSVEITNVGTADVVAGLHTIAARFSPDVLADGFKAYLQYCPAFITPLRRLAAGTKVYATTRKHIEGIEMQLPGLEEQIAIAHVFKDMDTEIQALEQRRSKTAELKQGMMQELLTGRTRLV